MNYRNLGSTGLSVSEIGLGCEGFAGQNGAMTKTLIDAAEEHGTAVPLLSERHQDRDRAG